MGKEIFFNEFITKDLHPIDGDQRFFEGYLTVQVKDKQGEITIVDELIKVLPIWMDRGAPISDTHSNRIIGKGISYAKTTYKDKSGEEYPAIKITGKIHKDYHLDDEIWDKIKSGEYKGLSFGGATKANRVPKIMKDGSVAYELKSLEHYEVAVCKDPAVPLALITDFNPLAKAITPNIERREDGKIVIRCNKFGCTVEKSEDFSNADGDRTNYYNQNVSDEKSSNRESSPVDDDDDVNIKREKEEEKHKDDVTENKKKDADIGYGSVRHSGKEYDTNQETTQVTEVKDDEEEEKERRGNDQNEKSNEMSGSGYQTEANNIQLGGQAAPAKKVKESNKSSENYINITKVKSDKDMEDIRKTEEEKDEEVSSKDEKDDKEEDKEEVEKAFQESIKSNMNTLTDVIKSLAETQKDVSSTLTEQNNALVNIGERLKALETPTDLPLKPKQSDKEDIGAKVTIPDTYQSNSVQVGLHDDKEAENKPKKDPSELKMQEKSNFDFTTETPRPNAAIDTINKSTTDVSFVLKDAREGGNLSVVARNILAGKYYTPTPDEVGTY